MTDNFALIRRTFSVPFSNVCQCEKCEAERNAPAALTAIKAELAALRENALDLSKVPTGWIIDYLDHDPDLNNDQPWCMWLVEDLPFPRRFPGDGASPAAALSAAIARIGGEG